MIPGNIIFRQRGTHWFPGENCKFGRDHCIFSTESGYVRYYRDPLKHPKRQYIGVVFDKEQKLPYPLNAARKRRLNMLPVAIDPVATAINAQTSGSGVRLVDTAGDPDAITARRKIKATATSGLRQGYSYRESNWSIGRIAERANVKVKEFVPGDRWTAWQKSKARIAKGRELTKLRNAGKKVAKPKPKTRR